MSVHHLLNVSTLDGTELLCIYCSEISDDVEWISEFCGEHHYKVFKCEHCNTRNTVKMEHHGSGHCKFGIEGKL